MIAVSFVRKASDIELIRELIGPKGAHIKIISKIQNHEGLHNYDEILTASDGIMIARAELGMEIPPEKVFIAQKWMIEKANIAAKACIVVNEILESMILKPRPDRAEASDIATTVLDGADCVLLANETGGKTAQYPIQSVSVLAKICCESEKTINHRRTYNDLKAFTPGPVGTTEAVAASTCSAVLNQPEISLIIVLTDSGKLARLVSKYRPETKILACSINSHVVRQMNMLRGVIGYKIPTFSGTDNVIQTVIGEAKQMKLCKSGSKIAVIHGTNEETPDEQNIMKILDA